MWYDTERQLRKCPFGHIVLDYARMLSLPDAKWELRYVHISSSELSKQIAL